MSDTIYLQPGAQVTVDGGEAGQLTIKASPSSMTWTTDKPTKEGWYWYREPAAHDERKLPRIIDVRMVEGELWTLSHLNRWGEYDGPYTSSGRPYDIDGEWYGPIEPPTE